jgi:hypothetical protein
LAVPEAVLVQVRELLQVVLSPALFPVVLFPALLIALLLRLLSLLRLIALLRSLSSCHRRPVDP